MEAPNASIEVAELEAPPKAPPPHNPPIIALSSASLETEPAQREFQPAPPAAVSAETPPGETKLEVRVLRDEEGKFIYSTQEEAFELCQNNGMRLPSIRELAELAKKKGAKGILGQIQAKEQDIAEGTIQIKAQNSDGKKEQFYYSWEGYSSPRDWKNLPPLGHHWFWSSSTCVNCIIGTGGNSIYVFDGWDGHIYDKYADLNLPISCVKQK